MCEWVRESCIRICLNVFVTFASAYGHIVDIKRHESRNTAVERFRGISRDNDDDNNNNNDIQTENSLQ